MKWEKTDAPCAHAFPINTKSPIITVPAIRIAHAFPILDPALARTTTRRADCQAKQLNEPAESFFYAMVLLERSSTHLLPP